MSGNPFQLAILATEDTIRAHGDRVRSLRSHTAAGDGIKRIFRIGADRQAARNTRPR